MVFEFCAPEGELTVQITQDALALAGVILPDVDVATWTGMERTLAYDWAMREHLIASDNDDVERRPKPRFVADAEKRAEMAETPQEKAAPVVPDREHTVQLTPAQAGSLMIWLTRPDGAFPMGRVTFELTAGGGILVRTRPYRAGDEKQEGLRLSACHRAMLEIMRDRGILGSTPRLLMDELQRKGFGPRRETVQHYLMHSSDRGLVEQAEYGRWKATRKLMESMP